MNKMSKRRQIEIITTLLNQSNLDYVENVYSLLIEEDLEVIKEVLGNDNYEALKTMILEEEIQEMILQDEENNKNIKNIKHWLKCLKNV